MNTNELLKNIYSLTEQADIVSVENISEGEPIPLVSLGHGRRRIIYASSGGASELESELLLEFAREYCSAYKIGTKLFSLPMEYMCKKFSIILIPIWQSKEEPFAQVGRLCSLLKFTEDIHGLCTFNAKSNSICYSPQKGGERVAMSLKKLYPISGEMRLDGGGTLFGRCANELSITYAEIGIGEKIGDSVFAKYTNLRRIMFCIPMLLP